MATLRNSKHGRPTYMSTMTPLVTRHMGTKHFSTECAFALATVVYTIILQWNLSFETTPSAKQKWSYFIALSVPWICLPARPPWPGFLAKNGTFGNKANYGIKTR